LSSTLFIHLNPSKAPNATAVSKKTHCIQPAITKGNFATKIETTEKECHTATQFLTLQSLHTPAQAPKTTYWPSSSGSERGSRAIIGWVAFFVVVAIIGGIAIWAAGRHH